MTVIDAIHLNVDGIPQPQGSKTRMPNGAMLEGKTPEARARFTSWREAIGNTARDWQAQNRQALIDGPVAIDITFRLPRPKSAPKHRKYPDTRPDVDKLARAVLDPLTGVIFSDDCRVVDMNVRKRFAVDVPPGVTILIWPTS